MHPFICADIFVADPLRIPVKKIIVWYIRVFSIVIPGGIDIVPGSPEPDKVPGVQLAAHHLAIEARRVEQHGGESRITHTDRFSQDDGAVDALVQMLNVLIFHMLKHQFVDLQFLLQIRFFPVDLTHPGIELCADLFSGRSAGFRGMEFLMARRKNICCVSFKLHRQHICIQKIELGVLIGKDPVDVSDLLLAHGSWADDAWEKIHFVNAEFAAICIIIYHLIIIRQVHRGFQGIHCDFIQSVIEGFFICIHPAVEIMAGILIPLGGSVPGASPAGACRCFIRTDPITGKGLPFRSAELKAV